MRTRIYLTPEQCKALDEILDTLEPGGSLFAQAFPERGYLAVAQMPSELAAKVAAITVPAFSLMEEA